MNLVVRLGVNGKVKDFGWFILGTRLSNLNPFCLLNNIVNQILFSSLDIYNRSIHSIRNLQRLQLKPKASDLIKVYMDDVKIYISIEVISDWTIFFIFITIFISKRKNCIAKQEGRYNTFIFIQWDYVNS